MSVLYLESSEPDIIISIISQVKTKYRNMLAKFAGVVLGAALIIKE